MPPDLTIESFVGLMPEFADVGTQYIQPYIDIANGFPRLRKWGNMFTLGASLWVAHYVYVRIGDPIVFTRGGNVVKSGGGANNGIIASKSGGGVSASYDTSATQFQNQPFWNMSKYGAQFYQLLRSFAYSDSVVQL